MDLCQMVTNAQNQKLGISWEIIKVKLERGQKYHANIWRWGGIWHCAWCRSVCHHWQLRFWRLLLQFRLLKHGPTPHPANALRGGDSRKTFLKRVQKSWKSMGFRETRKTLNTHIVYFWDADKRAGNKWVFKGRLLIWDYWWGGPFVDVDPKRGGNWEIYTRIGMD